MRSEAAVGEPEPAEPAPEPAPEPEATTPSTEVPSAEPEPAHVHAAAVEATPAEPAPGPSPASSASAEPEPEPQATTPTPEVGVAEAATPMEEASVPAEPVTGMPEDATPVDPLPDDVAGEGASRPSRPPPTSTTSATGSPPAVATSLLEAQRGGFRSLSLENGWRQLAERRGARIDERLPRPLNSPDSQSSSQRAPQDRQAHESSRSEARKSRSTSWRVAERAREVRVVASVPRPPVAWTRRHGIATRAAD